MDRANNWLATLDDGTIIRLDAAGDLAVPMPADLAKAAQRIAGSAVIAGQGLVDEEDAYHFKRRGEKLVLPVYRVVLGDGARYYLDPSSGVLLRRADASDQWHRWLFGALHRLDFSEWTRSRPSQDIIMLTLMPGGLGVTVTGLYLAIGRVRRDLARLFRPVAGEP